jgi:hypothetical protein
MAHIFFWAAAGVCALTVFIHVFLGGAKWVGRTSQWRWSRG